MANYTPNYQLHQWDPQDPFLRTDFNQDLQKIDTALGVIAANTNFPKLLDLTLAQDSQKWDIDMSMIDLTKYQKLVLYPHLKGNTDQWAYFRINQMTSGYFGPGNNTGHCGQIPMLNDTKRQNFGVCEYILLIELPKLYMLQTGMPYTQENEMPVFRGYTCPELTDGATFLDTINLWFDGAQDQMQAGSSIQIYGLRR